MRIELIRPELFGACNDFHNRSYGRNRSIAQWRWEFASTTVDDQVLPFAVAVDDGRVVGTQALIPIKMVDPSGVYWTAKSEETLVDPDYRGQRLFEKMYEPLFEYATTHHIRYIWGFTPATRAFERLGFLSPTKTTQLFFPFSVRAIPAVVSSGSFGGKDSPSAVKQLAYRSGVGVARLYSEFRSALAATSVGRETERLGVKLETLDQAPPKSGELCHQFISRWGGTTIYRDADYLNWRIFGNPYLKATFRAAYRNNRLLGWIAYCLADEGVGYIVDIMTAEDGSSGADDEALLRILLADAVGAMRKAGAYAVRGWRVNEQPFDSRVTKAAKSVGFLHLDRGHTVVIRPQPGDPLVTQSEWFDGWYVSRIFTEGRAG